MLRVEQVFKSYGPVRALNGLSFAAGDGEVVGIVGRNGAGKTTLFRILTGLIADYTGLVELPGERPPAGALDELCYLPEDPRFREEFTVAELFRFAALSHGLSRRETAEARDGLLPVFDLAPSLKKSLASLSKGTRKRAFFMAALANLGRARLLVLDEPFDGIDPERRVRIRGFLKGMSGRTILFSSHTLGDVEQLAGRVVFVGQGRNIREIDSLSGIRLEDEFLRSLESPA